MRDVHLRQQFRQTWAQVKPHDSVQRPSVNRYDLKRFLCISGNFTVLHYELPEKDLMVGFVVLLLLFLFVIVIFCYFYCFYYDKASKRCMPKLPHDNARPTGGAHLI